MASTLRSRPLLVATALLAYTACTPELEALDRVSQAMGEDQCPPWSCGANTPVMNGTPVDEFFQSGVPGGDEFRAKALIKQGQSFGVRVVGGALYGVDGLGNVVLQGAGVVGGVLRLVRDGKLYDIHVLGLGRVMTWTDPVHTLPTYHLGYSLPGSPTVSFVDLCNDPPVGDPLWSGLETHALLVEGERYDRDAKQVSSASGKGWVNIACAGSAVAKMTLMRYDARIPLGDAHATTATQRTAALKMITADYCGTGRSFTEMGTPLRWENQGNWVVPSQNAESSREALWTESGALCLGTPRLIANEQDGALQALLWAEIAGECAQAGKAVPPPCDDMLLIDGQQRDYAAWSTYSEWRTVNP